MVCLIILTYFLQDKCAPKFEILSYDNVPFHALCIKADGKIHKHRKC